MLPRLLAAPTLGFGSRTVVNLQMFCRVRSNALSEEFPLNTMLVSGTSFLTSLALSQGGSIAAVPLIISLVTGAYGVETITRQKQAKDLFETDLPARIAALKVHAPDFTEIRNIIKDLQEKELMSHAELNEVHECFLLESPP